MTNKAKRKYGTTKVKFERGVPIPPAARGASLRYPWDEMKVGNSVLLPPHKDRLEVVSIINSAYQYGKRHKMKFTSRKTDDGRMRVWRVA